MKNRGASKTKGRTNPKPNRSRFSRWNFAFLGLGCGLALAMHQLGPAVANGDKNSTATAQRLEPAAPSPGDPWGAVEITPLVLDRPEEYFDADLPPPPNLRWFFPTPDRQKVARLLQDGGLTAQLAGQLTETNRCKPDHGGLAVSPPLELVRGLEPAARERLYRILGTSPVNVPHFSPFVFRANGFEDWFADSGLRPETIDSVRPMVYLRNGVLCFSDTYLLRLTLPPSEAKALVQHLTRVPTLIMTLRLSPASDLEALLQYWGKYRSRRDLEPLVESMTRLPDGVSINVSYFFPALARQLLYTYPDPTNSLAMHPPDCFWTAFNFSRPTRDDRTWDETHVRRLLETDYRRVARPEEFGDLILLHRTDPSGRNELIHLCVYVAAEVVFTKNGKDLMQPWVLLRLDDMMALYAAHGHFQTACYRPVARPQ